jgi:hypothetical protein
VASLLFVLLAEKGRLFSGRQVAGEPGAVDGTPIEGVGLH